MYIFLSVLYIAAPVLYSTHTYYYINHIILHLCYSVFQYPQYTVSILFSINIMQSSIIEIIVYTMQYLKVEVILIQTY